MYTARIAALLCLAATPASAQWDTVLRNLLQQAAPASPPAYAPPNYAPPRYVEPSRPYAPVPPDDPRPRFSTSRAPASRGATNGDKFCTDNNTNMFLVRRSGDDLEFGLSSWNGRGHLFSLSGLAHPSAGGWLFRQNMTARDVAARCEARIETRPDGGYAFTLTRAGPCSDGQGFAYSPGERISFPYRARIGGIPAAKTMAAATSMESGGESCPIR